MRQNTRIEQLTELAAAANELADLLAKQYGSPDKWMGPSKTDYVISNEIVPTFDKMQTITVKVMNVTLKVDSTTSVLSTDQQVAGSATFSVRRYSALTPEIGVGAVFGSIKQPKLWYVLTFPTKAGLQRRSWPTLMRLDTS